MRDDLQVDKGNGVGWGFTRDEPGPILENTEEGGGDFHGSKCREF